jgi:predicted nucleic acid-binding Zn ribbon protein
MDKVSSLITTALAKRGLAHHALASLARTRVQGWLQGRFSAAHAPTVGSIKEGVLLIDCPHPIVLQELQVLLPDLKAFLCQECPFAHISDIRISRSSDPSRKPLAPGNTPA